MVRSLLYVFWSIILFCGLKAQNFSIENTEVISENPYKFKILLTSKNKISKENIQILQQSQNIDFEFTPLNVTSNSKSFCILVETTGFTHQEPIKNFKNSILKFVNLLNEGDKVALCSFSEASSNEGTSLKVLTKEFTEDKALIKSTVSKLVSKPDSNAKADIYKSIYEALDWMAEQKDLSETKYLIVFTAGIDYGLSSIKREDCESKAKKLRIPIYTLVHRTWSPYSGYNFKLLSDNTQGHFNFIDKEKQILEFLSAALNLNEKSSSVLSNHYELVFIPEKVNSGINIFEVKVKDETLNAEFVVEKKIETQMETLLFLGVGLGILLIGIGLFLKNKKNTTNEISNEVNQSNLDNHSEITESSKVASNSDISKTMVNSLTSSEPLKTAIASSHIPTLKVVSVSGVQHFTIEKLPIKIGRDDTNDLVIQDNSVSKKHAELYFEKGFFYLVDLDSTNGLVVNGQKLTKVQLNENEKVYLGNATIELYLA